MTPDPKVWCQRQPGGAWYKIGGNGPAHRVKVCPRCKGEFLGPRKQITCSKECQALLHRKGAPHYKAAHDRVYRAKGKASFHQCVDCGQQAEEWSYDGKDSEELTDPRRGQRYSLKIEHYQPRCQDCHTQYDLDTATRGERNPNSKLTAAQVRGIRASVGAAQQELADHFGVTQPAISLIRHGKNWKEPSS
jgi:hypothetical protein